MINKMRKIKPKKMIEAYKELILSLNSKQIDLLNKYEKLDYELNERMRKEIFK